MSDAARADALKRLACVRGHLAATVRMVECGADDRAVAHQLHAVCGALTQIQARLLRAQIDRWVGQPLDPRAIERDLGEIVKTRKR